MCGVFRAAVEFKSLTLTQVECLGAGIGLANHTSLSRVQSLSICPASANLDMEEVSLDVPPARFFEIVLHGPWCFLCWSTGVSHFYYTSSQTETASDGCICYWSTAAEILSISTLCELEDIMKIVSWILNSRVGIERTQYTSS